MNRREAKIVALEIASGILWASCDTMEVDEEYDREKVEEQLERIAYRLWQRAMRLRECDGQSRDLVGTSFNTL